MTGKYIPLLILVIIFISGCSSVPDDTKLEAECSKDSDCVPASCCHPDSCVPAGEAPNCEGMMCTMECKPGTLDCGQGSCKCIDNKCKAVLK